MSTRQPTNKIKINWLMLLLCPGLVIAQTLLPGFFGSGDTLRYYVASVILVHILLMYIPTHRFISVNTDAENRFGQMKINLATAGAALTLGLGLFCITEAAASSLYSLFLYINPNITLSPLQIEGGWRFFAMVLLMVVVPAYAEESLFRGALLFSWLPGGKWAAILHAALLCALVSLNPITAPALFLNGVVLGLIACKSGSCYTAVFAQGCNKLLAVGLTYYLGRNEKALAFLNALSQGQFVLYLALCGAVLLAAGYAALRVAAKFSKAGETGCARMIGYGADGGIDDTIWGGVQSGAPKFAVPAVTGEKMVVFTYVFLLMINVFL
ncbi:MAG: CPBP family intramembrane metalloprotease, partial [Clostridiales bacterium]|nr:CPBP family intramembrane metalloprotease [Clostridiales bacterium]